MNDCKMDTANATDLLLSPETDHTESVISHPQVANFVSDSQSVVILVGNNSTHVPHDGANSTVFEEQDHQIVYIAYTPVNESLLLLENSVETSSKTRKTNCRTEQIIGDELKVEEKLQVLDAILSQCESQDSTNINVPSLKSEPIFAEKSEIQPSTIKDGKYVCDLCGAVFKQVVQYYGHLHSHAGERSWICDKCPKNKVFSTESLLRRHEKSHHFSHRPYKCDVCEATYERASQVEYHRQRVHAQHRGFPCRFCKKAFYKRSDLRSHLAIHLSLQRCVCEVCGRSFSHISNLIRHSRLHTGIKPYPCSVCGRRFAQLSSLKQHKIGHENLSLPCPALPDQCSKRFRSPLVARKHARTVHPHVQWEESSGEQEGVTKRRHFYCTICGHKFQFAADMRNHQLLHHEASCNSCGQDFASAEDLKDHRCTKYVKEPCNDSEEAQNQFLLSKDGGSTHVNKRDVGCDIDNSSNHSESFAKSCDEEIYFEIDEDIEPSSENTNAQSYLKTEERADLSAQIETLLQDPNASSGDHESDEIVIYVSQGDDTPHEVRVKTFDTTFYTSEIGMGHEGAALSTSGLDHSSVQDENVKDAEDRSASIDIRTNDINPLITATKGQKCDECGKYFEKASNLKQHLGTHFSELQRYHCHHCGQSFAWKSTMNKHMLTQHKGLSPRFSCNTCGKHYASAGQAHDHVRRDHLGLRPHGCHLCSKTFFKKHDLQTHMRVHTKEKPYMCGTCGKSFYHVSHMKRHELTHGGVKKYQCSVCGCMFSQSSSMNLHERRHFLCDSELHSS